MATPTRKHALIARGVGCLVAGLAVSLGVCALLASFLFPSHWVATARQPSDFAPTYLAPIAPELREVYIAVPGRASSGNRLLWGINLGVDHVSYGYGASMWDAAFRTWDPLVTPGPPSVHLSRYRFGWPLRVVSMDDITTGTTINNSVVAAYHQRAYELAGAYRGIPRPSWLPGFVPLRRVPVVVDWINLGLNSLFWAAVAWCATAWGARWMTRSRNAARVRRGQCAACAYELAGLPTCPECGGQARW